MKDQDIRWIQRFNNFVNALAQLRNAVLLAQQRQLSKLEEQGLIQSFEFTHELAWNTLKDFLESRGVRDLYGSKDTTKEAFRSGLIEHGEIWMQMIISRNLTTHTYDETTARKVVSVIRESYYPEFDLLQNRLDAMQQREEQ